MNRIVALAGGVGGAKLAQGLQHVLPPGGLSVVVNTGDDDEFHGLTVCADHDTILYTLAGLADRERGWGRAAETWNAAEELARFGEPAWFRLGDRDLALHVHRTHRLAAGDRLTVIARDVQRAVGCPTPILPMSDSPVRTRVRTDEGWLAFQDWFVRLRAAPPALEVAFAGIETAAPPPEVTAALASAEAVIICPSNPFVSVGPILAVPGMAALVAGVRARGGRVVAVSPIVAGRALKGPADRMFASLGLESSCVSVARLYADVADVLVIDSADEEMTGAVEALGVRAVVAPTVMSSDESRAALARVALAAAWAG